MRGRTPLSQRRDILLEHTLRGAPRLAHLEGAKALLPEHLPHGDGLGLGVEVDVAGAGVGAGRDYYGTVGEDAVNAFLDGAIGRCYAAVA